MVKGRDYDNWGPKQPARSQKGLFQRRIRTTGKDTTPACHCRNAIWVEKCAIRRIRHIRTDYAESVSWRERTARSRRSARWQPRWQRPARGY